MNLETLSKVQVAASGQASQSLRSPVELLLCLRAAGALSQQPVPMTSSATLRNWFPDPGHQNLPGSPQAGGCHALLSSFLPGHCPRGSRLLSHFGHSDGVLGRTSDGSGRRHIRWGAGKGRRQWGSGIPSAPGGRFTLPSGWHLWHEHGLRRDRGLHFRVSLEELPMFGICAMGFLVITRI